MAGTLNISKRFSKVATAIAYATGRPSTFILCCAVVICWAASGPIFRYSDTWQLVINTSTTIVTFLMVFLIQNTQNRDGAAIQAKLDELIRVSAAQNAFIGIEHLSEEELDQIRKTCEERAKRADASDPADAAQERAGKLAREAADHATTGSGTPPGS